MMNPAPVDRQRPGANREPFDVSRLTDELAVGGCFPIERVDELAGEQGVRAVIDLRREDCDDEWRLARAGIAFLHLPTPDLEAASTAMLNCGVEFARPFLDRGERVLVHCQHGIGRSALLALCILVDRGLAPLEALALAKDRRARVSPSEAQYRGWADWLRAHGHAPPSYHEFGRIAYRHLAQG